MTREAESNAVVTGPNGERVSIRFYPDGAIRLSVTKAAGFVLDDVRLGKTAAQPTNITLTPKS